MTKSTKSHRGKLIVVYAIAVLLMIVRVDVWWWGEDMPAVLLGWLNLPMLYQFGIWLVGYLLVLYVANVIWDEGD